MIRLLTIVTLALCSVSTLGAEERLVIKDPLFSYLAPAGWAVRSLPQSKFKICHAAPDREFAPNINVVIESAPVGLDAYVNGNMAGLGRMFRGVKVVSNTPFTSAKGAKGRRLIVEFAHEGRQLRNLLYIFTGKGNRKYVVTGSGLKVYGSKYDQAFDSAAQTFAVK